MYLRKCLLWTNALFQSIKPGSLGQASFMGIWWSLPKEQSTGGADQSVGPPVSTLGQCLSGASLFHHFFCLNHHGSLIGLLDCSHSSQRDPLKMFQWLCISFRIKSGVLVMANKVPSELVPWHHLSSSPGFPPFIMASCLLFQHATPARPLRLASIYCFLCRNLSPWDFQMPAHKSP